MKVRKMHREDLARIYRFIDYARLKKSQPENVQLEIDVRRLAERVRINPDVSNGRLAGMFASRIEAKVIV